MRRYRIKTETTNTIKELSIALSKLCSPKSHSLLLKKPSPFQSPSNQFSSGPLTSTRTKIMKIKREIKQGSKPSRQKHSQANDTFHFSIEMRQFTHSKSKDKSKISLKPDSKFFKKSNKTEQNLREISKTLMVNSYVAKENKKTYEFKMLRRIGKSQTGDIILAFSNAMKMVVALKTFDRKQIKINFFIDEIKIQLFCTHPHILPAYGYYVGRNEAFLIMEVGHHNLYKEILQQGPFEESKAAYYAFQVLEAIDYLHRHGVMHRDLKPENIICYGQVVKITDFGWSIKSETKRRTLCGTLDYISPEVANSKNYDNKIDCWSAGVLIFEMLTTKPPFNQEDKDFKFEQLAFPQHITQVCQNLIMQLLEPNPSKRLSARDAINHPWIKIHRKRRSEELSKFPSLKEECRLIFN